MPSSGSGLREGTMDDEKAIEWIERSRDFFVLEFGDEASAGEEACELAIDAVKTLAKVRKVCARQDINAQMRELLIFELVTK